MFVGQPGRVDTGLRAGSAAGLPVRHRAEGTRPSRLPPSGRLPPGFKVVPIAGAWGLANLTGPGRTVLDFLSNMYSVNGILTLNFNLFAESIRHLILPAIALGTIPMAIIARMTRSSLLEVLGQDYVRTARAKGMMPRTVLLRHGLRNALLPVVTVIGLSVGALLSGAVLTETIFGLAGIGTDGLRLDQRARLHRYSRHGIARGDHVCRRSIWSWMSAMASSTRG